MSDIIDDYIIQYTENRREEYLILHEFILSCSELIYFEKKFNMPFYMVEKWLLYVAFDKNVSKFYIAFCLGHLLKDKNSIFEAADTKLIRKWYFNTKEKLRADKSSLKQLILDSIAINLNKSSN